MRLYMYMYLHRKEIFAYNCASYLVNTPFDRLLKTPVILPYAKYHLYLL